MRRCTYCPSAFVSRTSCCVVAVMACCAGCATLGPSKGRADLVGTLWWVSPEEAHGPIEAWRVELDHLQALGMNLMVLNGPFVGEDLAPGAADPMEPFFEEADRRGMTLYLDTYAAPNWWTLQNPAEEIARAAKRIQVLEERYGPHESFKGFYIPYELYVMWDAQRVLIQTLYREVSAACKRVAPHRLVMISPFFILDEQGYLGDFRWATPEEYEVFWQETLGQAQIDIVALQDSGEHLACYTLEQRRPFFAAMKRACVATGVTLWANIETGELNVASLDEYVARFGWKTHVNDPKTRLFWHGVPAEKLVEKLRFVRAFTPTAITWGYREFIRPSQGTIAAQLYAEYREALRPKKTRQADKPGVRR